MFKVRLANLLNNPRIQWVINIDDHQTMISRDVRLNARYHNIVGVIQRAARIESAVRIFLCVENTFQIVVQRIAIKQRRRIYDYQPFMLVYDIEISIKRMNRLL